MGQSITYLIDGNNLLHAAPHHLPGPVVGRQRLCEILGLWAKRLAVAVTVVFDGAAPRASFAAQMRASGIDLIFSAPRSADEVLEQMIEEASRPTGIWVVSGDRAIQSTARRHRCHTMSSSRFARDLVPRADSVRGEPAEPETTPEAPEKPTTVSPQETEEWLRRFDFDAG